MRKSRFTDGQMVWMIKEQGSNVLQTISDRL
jgi:hypothetical protein